MARRHDTVLELATPLSTIAGALFSAEDALLTAEKRLEALLDSVYVGDWQDYDWDRYDGSLDVYNVTPSDAAVDTLVRVGFRKVTQHGHASTEFSTCACRRQP